MSNILFSFFSITLMLQFFFFGLNISSVNKTLLNIPISIFQINIALDKEKPYFYQSSLEEKVYEYFDSSLKKKIDNYSLSFNYFDTEDDLFCKSDYCDKVKITLSTSILFFQYSKTMQYEIQVNYEY